MNTSVKRWLGKQRTGCMMAVVLGTALSAVGAPGEVAASTQIEAETLRDLTRYCTTCWRNAHVDPGSWSDCTQDVFGRLLERLAPDAWERVLRDEGEERREFLRAIDAVKKRTQRARGRYTMLPGPVPDHNEAVSRRVAEDRAAVDQAAASLLSTRQQRILRRTFEGWSVHEIAKATGMAAERVSDEKYKAIRKLREYFVGRDQDC